MVIYLPIEIVEQFTYYLDIKSALKLTKICKEWHKIFKINRLWNTLYKRDFRWEITNSTYKQCFKKYKNYFTNHKEILNIASRLNDIDLKNTLKNVLNYSFMSNKDLIQKWIQSCIIKKSNNIDLYLGMYIDDIEIKDFNEDRRRIVQLLISKFPSSFLLYDDGVYCINNNRICAKLRVSIKYKRYIQIYNILNKSSFDKDFIDISKKFKIKNMNNENILKMFKELSEVTSIDLLNDISKHDILNDLRVKYRNSII